MEEYLIHYGAPTLFGTKAASMFAIHNINPYDVDRNIKRYNQLLNPDIFIKLLRRTEKSSLILVYKTSELHRIISCTQCKNFLYSLGYECKDIDCVINTLINKFVCLYPSMPHEVGVLLDYPLEDVQGFINCQQSHTGRCRYWKSYSDSKQALQKEATYNEIKHKAINLYKNGLSLLQIIEKMKGGSIDESSSSLLVGNG